MPRPTVILTAVLLLAACGGKPKPETPIPDSSPQSGAATASTDPGRAERERAERERAERERAEREQAASTLARPIYFGYDQATLSQAARTTLDEYNLALGMRRATAAQMARRPVDVSPPPSGPRS